MTFFSAAIALTARPLGGRGLLAGALAATALTGAPSSRRLRRDRLDRHAVFAGTCGDLLAAPWPALLAGVFATAFVDFGGAFFAGASARPFFAGAFGSGLLLCRRALAAIFLAASRRCLGRGGLSRLPWPAPSSPGSARSVRVRLLAGALLRLDTAATTLPLLAATRTGQLPEPARAARIPGSHARQRRPTIRGEGRHCHPARRAPPAAATGARPTPSAAFCGHQCWFWVQ